MAFKTQVCIDKEIIQHMLSICDLRTQRNALSPIGRLPTEMLQSIFVQCARKHYERMDDNCLNVLPEWVKVSYVCRHWRKAALDCPTLWSYHFVLSPRWTEELLARSKRASLKIWISCDHLNLRHIKVLLKKLVDQVERIQQLRLVGFDDDDDDMEIPEPLSMFFLGPLTLQNLVISSKDGLSMRTLPILDADTPALLALESPFWSPTLSSLKLAGLTTLRLRHVYVDPHYNMGGFLAGLNQMQNLTCLYIEHALGTVSDPAPITLQKINLPRLSRLLISAPLPTVITLLSLLNIPLKTQVRLKCHFEYCPCHSGYAALPALLVQMFGISEGQAMPSPAIRFLVARFCWAGPTLTFSTSEPDYDSSVFISHADWDRNIPLKIFFYTHGSGNTGESLISDICCSMPLITIENLHVIWPPPSITFWREMLGHLSGLRHIKISHGYMPDLSPVLSFVDPEGGTSADVGENGSTAGEQDATNTVLATPELETLELDDVSFSAHGRDPISRRAHRTCADFDLLTAYNARRVRIVMTQCVVDETVELDANDCWDTESASSEVEYESDFSEPDDDDDETAELDANDSRDTESDFSEPDDDDDDDEEEEEEEEMGEPDSD